MSYRSAASFEGYGERRSEGYGERGEAAPGRGRVRVGVLSTHNSKETKAILNAVEALGGEPVWLRAENTALRVVDGEPVVEPRVDVVANRLLLSRADDPAGLLGLADAIAAVRPVLNPPTAVLTALHKFSAAMALASGGVRVPDAFLPLDADRLDPGSAGLGPEGVYKAAIGTHGREVRKVGPGVAAPSGEGQGFLQSFVDTPGDRPFDLRVYVVGGRIEGAMCRYAPAGDWRTNVALGGEVEDATGRLPAAAARLARRAVETIGLDYAGVDLIEGTDGWHVLEVNPTAGFKGLYAATGRSVAPHIARLAIERAGGAVDPDRVRELETVLDDSVPSCKPGAGETPSSSGDGEAHDRVEIPVIAGPAGSEGVATASDTGPAR